ncbi:MULTISPECIES: hypothetical protein [Rhodococcus]|uniref:hypothetical protein n=1 Tax=Rhodococcus TaxID=1827 RepID=UPI0007181286|nr:MULTISPECIES: hypothetical protein [Rhodococcus]MCZ4618585.1 hypothetical protein [Rhodococcus qingshengii]MEA1798446.1 hypothetical protein [Rhodococcus qingshengii]ORI27870.1 hypothetical protein BH686_01925 [Rhodococcus erythropolis]
MEFNSECTVVVAQVPHQPILIFDGLRRVLELFSQLGGRFHVQWMISDSQPPRPSPVRVRPVLGLPE